MNNLKYDKIRKNVILIWVFVLYFIFFMGIFFLMHTYFHEFGHILFGYLDSLIKGKPIHFTISNWMNHPIIQFIKIPQQTKVLEGQGSLNFALGGPLFSILSFAYLSFLGYFRSKDKKWFLLLLSIVLFEISGNIICGTDNLTGNPLSFCSKGIDLIIQYCATMLFSGTFSYFVSKKFNSVFFKSKQLKIRDYTQ